MALGSGKMQFLRNQSIINHCFIVRPKVDQRAGQLKAGTHYTYVRAVLTARIGYVDGTPVHDPSATP